MNISPARLAAFSALLQYRRSGQVSVSACSLDTDRRLAENIFFGVLQNERFLDFCLTQLVEHGYQRLHPAVQDILRLSAYQLLFLDRIPGSAVVNDAVSLCKKNKFSYAAGLVNAVLRRCSAKKQDFFSQHPDLSVRFSHPDWMVSRLLERYGESFTHDLLLANQAVPELHLQINTRLCSLDRFCKLLREEGINILSVQEELPSVHLSGISVESLPGYTDGLFYVQDDAARWSVRLAGIRPGDSVLDLCSAPGGKSIAAELEGGRPISCDISEKRLKRCAENFQRLHMDIPVRAVDATQIIPEWFGTFSFVIADVPCSGTGVIRKHPEIRKKTEADFLVLLKKQQEILDAASNYVAVGGALVYSTCSVMSEENEWQIESFLKDHPGFSLEPLPAASAACKDGMFHSWTHLTGNDGFFAAKLRKHG